MTGRAKKLTADDVGLPRFAIGAAGEGDVFSLSSHERARGALEFGLSTGEPGFNIFVLGEDRSGRMTATTDFLNEVVAQRDAPDDWIYLTNFRRPHRPKPYRLPNGVGRHFRDRMAELLPQLRETLGHAFTSEDYQTQVRAEGEKLQTEVARRLEQLRAEAQAHGLDLVRTPQGAVTVAPAPGSPGAAGGGLPPEQQAAMHEAAMRINGELEDINRQTGERQGEFGRWVRDLNHQVADQATGRMFGELLTEFGKYRGLSRWLTEAQVDILENLAHLHMAPPERQAQAMSGLERRYAVNLFVDHSDDPHPSVVVDSNVSYENLFGRMEYRQSEGLLETDFMLIRAGSLHRANGGVLVLRAEGLASNPMVWAQLKAALRDGEIRVEEPFRMGQWPIAGAPRSKPIPLDVKVIIVGPPRFYYAFFSVDPEFQTFFKVKADIDADMDATPENLATYAGLIQGMAARHDGARCDEAALVRLLGMAARHGSSRRKLSARFEAIEDLISEAAMQGDEGPPEVITDERVVAAIASRRQRNARVEDRMQENIAGGTIMIDTQGEVIGQVNALVVRDMGDYAFGAPSRVTARASIGRRGVINIERDVELGGPIQQKGVMVLQGFLAGHFARRFPLSFNCSITFEQSYGGVEGDSASLAELLVTVSDLAHLPLRQDLAITGSVNQRGQAQAVGGVRYKVEGFFRTCTEAGGLTGEQGVAVPASCEDDLVLSDEVAEAIANGTFHMWSVATADEAIELFTGVPAGEPDAEGQYPAESVYGRVMVQLEAFDRILTERGRA